MALVSDTVFSLLVLASGVFAASTLGFAVAWIRARERAIRAEQRAAPVLDGADARVDRLEQAVESIVVEVERMSEGQRFVSRLLTERQGQERDASVQPARAVTPH
jgi:SpoVK/Ycf46/Vps4 family AAA+-type ATPase